MGNGEKGVKILDRPDQDPATTSGPPGVTATGPVAAATPGTINPTALTVAQAARMLGVGEQTIRDHMAAGVPTVADGTINLVQYAAWLVREAADHRLETGGLGV